MVGVPVFLIFLLTRVSIAVSLLSTKDNCPALDVKVWTGMPKDEEDAGKYTEVKNASLEDCIQECCASLSCNAVYMHKSEKCFLIDCVSEDGCTPSESKYEKDIMVRVRPVRDYTSQESNKILFREDEEEPTDERGLVETLDPLIGSDSETQCSCPGTHEVCDNGVGGVECICSQGYMRHPSSGVCVPSAEITNASSGNSAGKPIPALLPKMYGDGGSAASTLTVNVRSKEIRLPENEATLNAYVVPAEQGGSSYQYKWEVLSRPEGSQAQREVKGSTLRLTRLVQGLYTFKVTVTSPTGSIGSTLANLTVLPQNRENKPPVVVVRPTEQTVKLPNSMAVLDASTSHDDTGIVKFHWELQEGPLGYQLNSTDTETLILKNLQKPGNYTFRVNVADKEGTSSSAIARVEVLEAPDYPPVANAGPSMVIYLPKNNVTLNGSLSSDDKGIVSWEWTKAGKSPAVDMQDTHTPYLRLSLLTEGLYTFVLRVTDALGQSSSSKTIVLVKAPTNAPPSVHAGGNITFSLPQTWAVLNGSTGLSDAPIVSWLWTQLSGPKPAVLNPANASVTNVTSLTRGEYSFRLKATDFAGNIAEDVVYIKVTQNVNMGPKADAGGDQTVTMPVDVLIVNGSRSSDDVGITRWEWTREPTSLAIGTVINHSDKTPILMVTNIVTGRYEFRLRVTDEQGLSSDDTVSINVKPDPERPNLVELTLNVEAWQLMETQKRSVLAALGVVLKDASELVVRDMKTEAYTGRASLVFYCSGSGGPLPGPSVVSALRSALLSDTWTALNLSVASLRTVVCQNNCSGHGVCIESTRACLCEAFWMEDLISKYFGNGEANCDWSILYVLLSLVCLMAGIVLLGWGVACAAQAAACCPSAPAAPTPTNKYKLLNSTEHIKMGSSNKIEGDYSYDDETDSDVLFESRSQQRSKRSVNGRSRPLIT